MLGNRPESWLTGPCYLYSSLWLSHMYLSIHVPTYYIPYTVSYGMVSDSRFHPDCVLELLLSLDELSAQCIALAVSLLRKAARMRVPSACTPKPYLYS